jgi:hypothetical protein
MKLDHLVNVLGAYGARLAVCPLIRTVELYSVAIRDPMDPRAVVGDVFLAVGAQSAVEGVELAAAAQASLVMIRGEDLCPKAAQAAQMHRLAVLLVDPAISWSQLAGMVYGLVMEGRETAAGRGPTDLFALADTLADAVGGVVVIQDEVARVLAYSNLTEYADPVRVAIVLERRVPDRVRELYQRWGVYAHLATSDKPMFVPPDIDSQFNGRTVVAVRVGKDFLGSIWVEGTTPFSDAQNIALEDGARTVALHLLRSRASADLERRVESEFVTLLLDGAADAQTLVRQAGLPAGPLRVIALRAHVNGARHAASLLAFERATSGFGWSRPSRSTLLGETVYTIVPGENLGPARAWVRALRGALTRDLVVSAGIGSAAMAPDLPASRREADEALALHETCTVVVEAIAYDESWFDILVQRVRTAAGAGRRPPGAALDALRRHDAAHATNYVATLRAWLDAQGDLVNAGLRVAVHPNTVRYRLRKITELTRLDLKDPRQRLAMLIDLATSDG